MAKRTASDAFEKPSRSRSLSPSSRKVLYGLPSPPYSPESSLRSAPARLQSRIAQNDSSSNDSEDEVVNEDEDPVLYRILTGLEYARAQHAHRRPVMQTTRVILNQREHLHSGSALDILRQASQEGYVIRIALTFMEGDVFETWEIGVPRPDWVTEGAFGGLHDPQWFHNIDVAQVKAGPFADEADIKKAQATLKGAETRRKNIFKKSRREQEIDWKLQEWHRRHKNGEKMWDSDYSGSKSVVSASEESDSTTDLDSSDDELLGKAVHQPRPAVSTSHTSSRKRSVSSDGSNAYEPSSSSDTEFSDYEVLGGNPETGTGTRSRPQDSDSNDDEPLMLKLRRREAAQQFRTTVSPLSSFKSTQAGVKSGSENDEPFVPVRRKASRRTTSRRRRIVESSSSDGEPLMTKFRRWQTAQKSQPAGDPLTTSNSRRPAIASSSDEEDSVTPWRPILKRQVRLRDGTVGTRRRPIVLEISDSD